MSDLAYRQNPKYELIDMLLLEFKEVLGGDFMAYRNHCMRVYFLSEMHFPKDEFPFEPERANLAKAAAFHDIGLWTAGTWNYIRPSIAACREETSIPEADAQEAIIAFHHKLSRYRGLHERQVEAFRRADWMDVTFGWKFGRGKRQAYRELKKAFPYLGFHGRLVSFFFRNLLKRPWSPLPMFRL